MKTNRGKQTGSVTAKFLPLLLLLLASASCAFAATHHVDVNSANPTAPYTNWATAATVIQDAVDAAVAGDDVVVTNGAYATGGRAVGTNLLVNRVVVDKPLVLRSVNGAGATIIDGRTAVRCVWLADGGSLSGFTLTNGSTPINGVRTQADGQGGGVWCESANAVVSNCVFTGNSALNSGGGASGGRLFNCMLSNNSAGFDGGGASGCTLNRCALTGNSAFGYADGLGGGASYSTLNNCKLDSNRGGECGATYGCVLNNCTLTANSAPAGCGGACGGTLNNCILYFNTGPKGANYSSKVFGAEVGLVLNWCCTMPMPTNGFGNITNAPLFVDFVGGNLRLQSNSPCINAGNNGYVPPGPDLDGNPRTAGGTVDIGAYEFQSPASTISYAWLQQYGLPTDGSTDSTDPDADGMNNWQEWRCGTDPTNALSALRLLSASPNGTNLNVTWQSVSGVNYFLERSTALGTLPAFSVLRSNIVGQAGRTTYTDTNAVGAGPFFYRVGVR